MPLDQESRSRASAPAIALSINAPSRTVLVIGPRCERSPTALGGYCGTKPNDCLKPKIPQNAAGMRIEPAPSLPCARGPRPAATGAAAPPLDPPGVFSRFQGLNEGPNTRFPESPFQPSSGVLVFPSMTAPAAYNRSTTGASSSGTQSGSINEPRAVRMPRVGVRSLIDIGIPASGGASPTT